MIIDLKMGLRSRMPHRRGFKLPNRSVCNTFFVLNSPADGTGFEKMRLREASFIGHTHTIRYHPSIFRSIRDQRLHILGHRDLLQVARTTILIDCESSLTKGPFPWLVLLLFAISRLSSGF